MERQAKPALGVCAHFRCKVWQQLIRARVFEDSDKETKFIPDDGGKMMDRHVFIRTFKGDTRDGIKHRQFADMPAMRERVPRIVDWKPGFGTDGKKSAEPTGDSGGLPCEDG